MMSDWQPLDRDCYDPLKAGSVDGTDTEPHDRAVWRAMNAHYSPPDMDTKPNRTLFVGRLPHNIEEEQLHHKFSAFGVVEKISLVRDIVTGFSKGYCFVEYRRKRDAEHAVKESIGLQINGSSLLVDWEAGHQVKGWIPRRLGGGWGGRKEAGQLRFGCRDRPWKKPIVIHPSRPSAKEYGKDRGRTTHQDHQGTEGRHKREEYWHQGSQGSEDRHRRDSRHQGRQGFEERHRQEDSKHHGNQGSEDRRRREDNRYPASQGSDDRHRIEDNRHKDRQGSAEDRHRRTDYKHKEDMRRREERRDRLRDRTSDHKRRHSSSPPNSTM